MVPVFCDLITNYKGNLTFSVELNRPSGYFK